MYIDQFLNNHPTIKISAEVLLLCRLGEQKMQNSIDPLHDYHHIGRLLRNLTYLLKNYPNHKKINFEILLLSICWHDVWKANKKSFNLIKLFYYQIYEGIGSLVIFMQHATGMIDNFTIAEVNYAIRKHAQFQFFPLSSIEAKILKDIDDLDVLNPKRMRYLLSKIDDVNLPSKWLGKLWLKRIASEKTVHGLQLTWTKHKQRKINRIINQILVLV